MKAFMTNGTLDFLQKIATKQNKFKFHLMHNISSTLAYYEADGKSVFGAGRTYEIIVKSGEIQAGGYVVMNNVPLSEEGKPVFIDRFKQRQGEIDSMPGFQAFRLLKPVKGNTYVIFSQWLSEEDFEEWKGSEDFINSQHNKAVTPPAYFADSPFSVSYSMIDEEDLLE